jgi:hypothetical protein
MNKSLKIILTTGIMGFFVAAPPANAIPFTLTTVSFTPGSGYGIDSNERSGTLLDVQFPASGFASQSFNLNSSGAFFTFDLGTVLLKEQSSHGGINSNETDSLGVTAHFTFKGALASTSDVSATGTATTDSVSDIATDYTIVWNPITVAFGTGGELTIAMDSLSFNGNPGTNRITSQSQTGTITLTALPNVDAEVEVAAQAASVPEPVTLALFGLGLLGLTAVHRRTANNNTI